MPKGVYKKSAEHKRKLAEATKRAWAEGRLHGHKSKATSASMRQQWASGERTGHPHSEETRRKMSLAQRGRSHDYESPGFTGRAHTVESRERMRQAQATRPPHTAEQRLKQSASRREHMIACGGACGSVWCAPPSGKRLTGLALDLAGVLIDHGYDLIPEVRFGPYSVDFYEPELHIAFEADGQYWHQRPEAVEHDTKRDAYLLAEHELPVWRFAEGVIRGMQIGFSVMSEAGLPSAMREV